MAHNLRAIDAPRNSILPIFCVHRCDPWDIVSEPSSSVFRVIRASRNGRERYRARRVPAKGRQVYQPVIAHRNKFAREGCMRSRCARGLPGARWLRARRRAGRRCHLSETVGIIVACPHTFPVACIMSNASRFQVDLAAGEAVFREGDPGDAMYVIESGSIDILSRSRGNAPLARLGTGDFFGDMSMLEDRPRSADAVAHEASRVLRIDRAEFADLLHQNAEIGIRIMRKLAARQRRVEKELDKALAELARMRNAAEAPRAEASQAPLEIAAPEAAAAPAAPAQQVAVPAAPAFQFRHASGHAFPLTSDSGEMLIGRPDPVTGTNPDIDLATQDETRSMSRRHARLVAIEGGWALREEVGTVNGTFVNGKRIGTGESVPLSAGDRVRFGAVEVEYATA